MTSLFEKPSVLIVGAGEFGATTAVELLRSGNYSTVTIIDRASVIPAMDAASTDINKVVRFDYTDADYAKLAREAVIRWRDPKWKGIYNE
jgi:sarcosine oxidase/L-pipecolate oxidase